ncbi:GGDEF domain-containing protein [Alkaliphilus oremlandii]|uniref:Diguanylate cyclase n=1 Tax=Alkaliphilus oremlandii (strain OhILAs) TaxID=350688 RepID=A8MF55_ALKOO|nr:GGDEF domain-containing protein [Alkaliphilus oremlandii]ABW18724.1 diguanylate cyclase [Alkaliphilus oremlandii OhILAs]
MIQNIDGIMSKSEFVSEVENKISSLSETFTLASIDIDSFEAVNSYYGEYIGDQVLKKIASVLKQNLKANDLVCRENKDEFNVLFSNTLSETGFIMMEEIRKYLEINTFSLGEKDKKKDINIRISVGIANYPRNAKNAVDLFRAADSALFRAKREGKNRVYMAESENMVLKSSYYTKIQLERLTDLSQKTDKTEAFLLREALDDIFDKYSR